MLIMYVKLLYLVKHLEILEQFPHEENPSAPEEQHLQSPTQLKQLV